MPDAVDASRFRMRPAQGGSMGEFYAQAEHFLVDEGSRCPPLGALVVYNGDHGEAAHRVVLKFRKAGGLMVVTKGDANAWVDRPAVWKTGSVSRVWALSTADGLVWLKGAGELKRSVAAVVVAWLFISKCNLSGKSPLE